MKLPTIDLNVEAYQSKRVYDDEVLRPTEEDLAVIDARIYFNELRLMERRTRNE